MHFGSLKHAAVSLGLAAACLVAAPATAGAASLTIGDAYFLGYVNDGIPSSEALEANYINSLLAMGAGAGPAPCSLAPTETCDRTDSTLNAAGFPAATATGASKNESGANTNINVTGWTYLLGKYDGPNFGSLVWYVGGLNELVDIPAAAGSQPYGLSHYTLFNPDDDPDPDPEVPEPATLTLLGLALLGSGIARQRARRR